MLTSRTRRLASRTICKKRGECWCAIGLSEGQLIRSTVTAGHFNVKSQAAGSKNIGRSSIIVRRLSRIQPTKNEFFVPYYCNGSTRRIGHFFVENSYGYHILR